MNCEEEVVEVEDTDNVPVRNSEDTSYPLEVKKKKVSEDLKEIFEVKLIEALKAKSTALSKKQFMDTAKSLRLTMGIDDSELIFSRTWFHAFTKKQNVLVEK